MHYDRVTTRSKRNKKDNINENVVKQPEYHANIPL